MSYDHKHLLKFFKEHGFKSLRTNGKHEIYHDGYSQVPMPRSKSIGYRDCRNIMKQVEQAVRRRDEIIAKESKNFIKEEPVKTNMGELWPKIVQKEVDVQLKGELRDIIKDLLSKNKTYGEISTILNTMQIKNTTGGEFIPVTARKAAEKLGLVEKSGWGTKNTIKPKNQKELVKRAYTSSDEKEAELTIKILENILTTPDIKAQKKLAMIKRLIESSEL